MEKEKKAIDIAMAHRPKLKPKRNRAAGSHKREACETEGSKSSTDLPKPPAIVTSSVAISGNRCATKPASASSSGSSLANFRIPKLKKLDTGAISSSSGHSKRSTNSEKVTDGKQQNISKDRYKLGPASHHESSDHPDDIYQKEEKGKYFGISPMRRPVIGNETSVATPASTSSRGHYSCEKSKLSGAINAHQSQQGDTSISSMSGSQSSTLPLLPECDDLGPEEMDWDDPVPAIRRMWKDFSDVCAVPLNQNSSVSEEMDVDPCGQLIIVPDTNIWIDCINLLKTLLKTDFKKLSYPIVVIPWMVLQELDFNLKPSFSKNNPRKSRESVKFIHDLLASKHPQVKGQKASDAALSKLKFDELNADDSILQCVFQLQKNDATVIFLSNDRNLLNKALIHGLLAFDSQSTLAKITETIGGVQQDSNDNFVSSHNQIVTKPEMKRTHQETFHPVSFVHCRPSGPHLNEIREFQCRDVITEDDPMQDEDSPPKAKLQSFARLPQNPLKDFSQILTVLRDTISHIIECKMKEDYGDGWLRATKIKPPWTLRSGVSCIIHHWIAVFSFVFTPKGKRLAEKLLECIKSYETLDTKETTPAQRQQNEEDIVESTLAVFNMGKGPIMQNTVVVNCRQILLSYVVSSK